MGLKEKNKLKHDVVHETPNTWTKTIEQAGYGLLRYIELQLGVDI